ncbi:hypothetical protein E2562_000126 [Oryza meyeriana var. granulata]|uniref:Uncharacterized protein n=1 Tax=Oryza meyeriana var. granulata TaxID=110450 RepID=A0A6G1DBH6_9ORYZ|nr:hypothetical protein E2562_000126 [Oryza meyeriana var. granulata]
MGKNIMDHSNLSEEAKESSEHMKRKQQDSFVGTTKNDHVDHSELECSNMSDLAKKDVLDKVENLDMATMDVPKEVEQCNNLVNKTRRNNGKRTRKDNSGSKTKKSSDCSVQGHGMYEVRFSSFV